MQLFAVVCLLFRCEIPLFIIFECWQNEQKNPAFLFSLSFLLEIKQNKKQRRESVQVKKKCRFRIGKTRKKKLLLQIWLKQAWTFSFLFPGEICSISLPIFPWFVFCPFFARFWQFHCIFIENENDFVKHLPPLTSHDNTRLSPSYNGPIAPDTSRPDASYTSIWCGGTEKKERKKNGNYYFFYFILLLVN